MPENLINCDYEYDQQLTLENEPYIVKADSPTAEEIDEKIGLETILLRLNKELVSSLSMIVKEKGKNNYITLIREILAEYAETNIKTIGYGSESRL